MPRGTPRSMKIICSTFFDIVSFPQKGSRSFDFGGHTPSKKLTWAGSTHHELLPRKGVRIINFYL
jgi:hypothetical protein